MNRTVRIAVRCDGNQELASGHLMRCLSIAEELKQKGAEVFFCFADHTSEEWFRGDAFAREILESDYRSPRSEIPSLVRCLSERGADAVLIDHYHIDDAYLADLKGRMPQVKICVLDDFVSEGRDADLVINYTLPGRAEYAPIRRRFREERMAVRPEIKRVFVSTGGSDPCGMRGEITAIVRDVLPEAQICIPKGIDDMAAYMAECDLAVSAGGTTVYELCAVGVPAILFTMADNQQMLAQGVRDAVENAGDVRSAREKEQTLGRIRVFISRMAHDRELRSDVSGRMRQVTDGYGTQRIADEILRTISQIRTEE